MNAHHDGFTLVELLIAMVLALVVISGLVVLAGPLRAIFQARLETNDVDQRLRAAGESLFADLVMAGAGPDRGSRAGPLHRFFAPVLPFRLGVDAPGTVRDDALTIVYVPPGGAQASLDGALPARSAVARIVPGPGCSLKDPACGFSAGTRVLIYDDAGTFDLFTIESVWGASLELHHDLPDGPGEHAAGATIAAVTVAIYELDDEGTSEGPRLMRGDGGGHRQPIVDHVVHLHFDFWGDPRAPALRQRPAGSVPSAIWGPEPPSPGLIAGQSPPGESCTWTLDSAEPGAEPRTRLAALGSAAGPLVRLPAARLSDGPWCPDETAPIRFDADLFRIRRIRVTIRAESALDVLRGPAGPLFRRAGTARIAGARVPDRELSLEVAPRNLAAGW